MKKLINVIFILICGMILSGCVAHDRYPRNDRRYDDRHHNNQPQHRNQQPYNDSHMNQPNQPMNQERR